MPKPPKDAEARRAIAPVICYPNEGLRSPPMAQYRAAREGATETGRILIAPRTARCFYVTAGSFFRISCPDGPQVGDLNLFSAADPAERFFSGKTRALHGTHVSVGDRLWSNLPFLRPMATITADSLAWYGVDAMAAGCMT
jgi:uncharacterized protein